MSKYAFLIALVLNTLSIGASIDFPFNEGDKWLYASSFYQGPYPPTLFKGTSEFKIDSIRSVSDTSYQIFTRITNICSTPDTAFVDYFSFTWNNHGHIMYDNDYRPQFLNNCNGNDSCSGMPINSSDPSVNYNLGYSNIYGSTSMKLSYRLRTFILTNSYALISMNGKEITTSAIAKKNVSASRSSSQIRISNSHISIKFRGKNIQGEMR